MQIKLLRPKEYFFLIVVWAGVLWSINFICGLIVQNRYIAVDTIDKKTAKESYGYFVPNQEKIILFPGLKEYKVTVNGLGFRDTGSGPIQSLKEIEDQYKILTIGDSITFGLFIDDEASYPYQLQQLIKNDGKQAVVLNAGAGSMDMNDYGYYLKARGLDVKPDLVIISFCENDVEVSKKDPLYLRMKRDNVFSLARTIKLAKFMRVFRKAELAARYRRWIRYEDDPRIKDILQEDSKRLEDVLYLAKQNGGLSVTDPYNLDLKLAWQETFKAMDEMIALLREKHIDVLFVIFPDIATVFEETNGYYQDILIEYFKQHNVPYVDPLPLYKKKRDEYLKIYNQLPRDYHFSSYGNQIFSQEIYRAIKDKVK